MPDPWPLKVSPFADSHRPDCFRLPRQGQLLYLGPGGGSQKFVHIARSSARLKNDLTKAVALLPEVGGYRYEGCIADKRTSSPGFQYSLMLGTSF